MIEEDTGGGGGGGGNNKNADFADDFDDDDHEPCSKKVMPALFAWFLLISTSSSYFTLVLPEFINLIGLDQIYLFVTIVGVHAFVFLYVILNFSIATFMDPGRFPKVDLKEAIEEDGIHHSGTYKNVLINDINVRMKWCTTCQFYRPPRSSHCGVCNACIDTMDHHCPWVCNCIARRNYKYFLQFLISLTIHMLSIFGLCLTLVLYNKENLTHIPIIIALLLIIIVGILIIPIGGLTGFHLVLVSRGRTTNEQVTGKFRTGVNPFDMGCWANWKQVMCMSTVPSYIRFKRKRLKQKELLEHKLTLIKYQQQQQFSNTNKTTVHMNKYFHQQNSINNSTKKPTKKIYTNQENMLLNGNANNVSSDKLNKNPDLVISNRFTNNKNIDAIDVQNELQLKSVNSKRKQNSYTASVQTKKTSKHAANSYQPGQKLPSSRHYDEEDNLDEDEQNNLNEYHYENHYDNNAIMFQNYPNTNGNILNHKQIKQQQQLLEQQMFAQKQKQMNSNVWIDRKSNKIILNNNNSNASSEIDLPKMKKSYLRKNENSIDKIMSNERRLQQQLLLTNDGASSSLDSGSSRCIRNNSYLNANHNLNNNLVPNMSNKYAGVNHSNTSSFDAARPPSSSSTASSLNNGSVYSNLIKSSSSNTNNNVKKKRKAQSNTKTNNTKNNNHYQLEQLEIIDEKSAKSNDYASYEITV